MIRSNSVCPFPLRAIIPLIFVIAGCRPTFTEMVEMRDGIPLATDVYLPGGVGPWPVVVQRTPYGRATYGTVPTYWLANGVVVVSQDMRIRADSLGSSIDAIANHGRDGYDTLQWIEKQPWCNGRIATAGMSAAGVAQHLLAPTSPPGLVAMVPMVSSVAFYEHGAFLGGAFRQSLVEEWVAIWKDPAIYDAIAAHPYHDETWQQIQFSNRYRDVKTPALHMAGWYDVFQQGSIDAFMGYQYQGGPGAAGRQKLVIGPWSHVGFQKREQGELTYPENATGPPFGDVFGIFLNDLLQVGLAGIHQTADDIPPVQYYVMGDVEDPTAPGNVWRSSDNWPPVAAPVRLYLQSEGRLAERCPDGGVTYYDFDPQNPSPTVCGANLKLESGPCDQAAVESREDVVVFETLPLEKPLEITGRASARLFVSIDQADADVMVRLTDVYPDGRSMLITDGASRLATRGLKTHLTPLSVGEIAAAKIDLWSTSIIINRGHRLRISITSSNYPRFSVNRNNGLDYPDSIAGVGIPVKVGIYHDEAHPSYLELPDPNRLPNDYLLCEN